MPQLTPIRPIWRDERGAVLVAALVIMVLLMGVATIGNYSGYTNLLTSTNLRLATSARATAEANINEAVYRLSLSQGTNGVIVPDFSDADWHTEIVFDDTPGANQVGSLQLSDHWPDEAFRSGSTVKLEYKKDANDNLVFYNRGIAETDPPFLKVTLPDILVPGLVDPLAKLLDELYGVLCMLHVGDIGVGGVVQIGTIQVGGILGVCPVNNRLPDLGYPVIEVRGTGVNARGAERAFLAEAVRTVKFTPLAPLAAGGTVNLNSRGFIDGVNHHPGIMLTAGAGAGARYGDDSLTETTQAEAAGLLGNLVLDSPDDNNIISWLMTSILPPSSLSDVTWWSVNHAVANATLLAKVPLTLYTSFPRLYNQQISSGDPTPAWVGVTRLEDVAHSINLVGTGLDSVLAPVVQTGIWDGVNNGYRAAIALAAGAIVLNAPTPPGIVSTTGLLLPVTKVDPHPLVWDRGVFTWRINNKDNDARFTNSKSLPGTLPAVNTIKECGPDVLGAPASLTCRPAALAHFAAADDDWFQDYLGLDDTALQDLLDDPDTKQTSINSAGPIGFAYASSNFTWSAGNSGTNQFGLFYVDGDLTVSNTHTFKGLIFVEGNLTINTGASLTVLGAIMVRGNVTLSNPTGTMTLLYSREAANRGLQTAHPWRILSWADADVQAEAE